ncbi:GNAT family N-acetyltransferase [Tamlana sp. 2_MG-2023]|uniref:GNAT family N-acetyltransferase n=1 Tax=unclassified Tamlana TaxID=2614803 RepID=UPI0026E1C8F0|nr:MULTISPECIES: GNAT family N-acetyltransferase [unclassified Tamlana]MDO6759720.1 GNAT family N-acetyltransferase [Tamlana sp. 2_MG-2023]MDO6791343.1 GNAT family N-acetyltransferase [Tamlana sp. 1_MG-2023]
MQIIIETKRLWIREIEPEDIDCLLEIYNNPQNMVFIPNSNFKWTETKLKEKYQKLNQNYFNGFGVFIIQIKDKDTIIGEAGLFNSFQNFKHLELGYIVDHKFWRNGYGSEICNALINYGFQKLKLEKLTARMFKENLASIKLSEHCGMKLVKSKSPENDIDFYEYEVTNKTE